MDMIRVFDCLEDGSTGALLGSAVAPFDPEKIIMLKRNVRTEKQRLRIGDQERFRMTHSYENHMQEMIDEHKRLRSLNVRVECTITYDISLVTVHLILEPHNPNFKLMKVIMDSNESKWRKELITRLRKNNPPKFIFKAVRDKSLVRYEEEKAKISRGIDIQHGEKPSTRRKSRFEL